MGLLKTFLGIGSGISWIVYAVVFGLGLAVGTSGAAYVQQLRLDAVKATVESAELIAAAATANANANYKAAQECAAQVEQDKASIALQNAETEKLRANFNDMERAAVNLETEKAQLLQTLDERTQETEAEAKARPADVRELGPIAKARAAQLWN